MLLQLENANQDEINMLSKFARQNQLDLSLIEDAIAMVNALLPKQPMSVARLTLLIKKSRKSGMIEMADALLIIPNLNKR